VGHGKLRNVYTIVDRKSEWKRPLRRARHRWEGDIKMDLGNLGCEDVDWIYLFQDRFSLLGSCKHDNEA